MKYLPVKLIKHVLIIFLQKKKKILNKARIAKIKANLAKTDDADKRALIEVQLKYAKEVLALKKALKTASAGQKAAL